VLRRVLACAVGVGVVIFAAACSPVQMGAAAIVGQQRITLAQLDTQVAAYQQAYPKYAHQVQVTPSQIPSHVLSWLIRFQIRDQLAADAGINVTPAQVKAAIAQINAYGKQSAAQSGLKNYSLTLLMVANGIPPDMSDELGRYQAIDLAYLEQANGGTLPNSSSTSSAAAAKMTHSECLVAKSLSIQVSPQYGQLNYNGFTVNPTPDTLSLTSGSKPTSTSTTAPAC
jgi:hypothetical protein